MKNLCIVVIAKNNSIPWFEEAKALLKRAFEFAKVPYEFIEDLTYNKDDAHPSWYKLLAHRHLNYQYDYCLCWDLDLLPSNKHSVSDIISEINLEKFYACQDTSFVGSTSYFNSFPDIVENFRWNCGLLGIPKTHAHEMEKIYDDHHTSTKPSFEQYHVADYLYLNQDKIVDGNWLNNVMVGVTMERYNKQFIPIALAKCIHYTMPNDTRTQLILQHCSWKDRIFL